MKLLKPALVVAAALATVGFAVPAPSAVARDMDCSDFPSQRAAQIYFLNHGGPQSDPDRLDADGDGIACEDNPAPYYYGTTLPGGGGGGGDQQPQITNVHSTVRLAVRPGKRIAGELYRLTASVRPAISREIVVQRKVNGRWRNFAHGTTGGRGVITGTFKAPRTSTAYRAVVQQVTKGNKRYSAATSRTRTLAIQRQRVSLSFDDHSVAEGARVQARVRATPVRAGRPVVLQARSGGTWRTVSRARVNRRGQAEFAVTANLGTDAYRAVALRHRGAAPEQSRVRMLTATDQTPPPTPTNLVAVPGDGTVQLSWSQVTPADFSHNEVWVRTDSTAWSLYTTTGAQSVDVTGLQNDVTYWFSVSSVDLRGNASAKSTAVSAMPTAVAPRARVAAPAAR
ncbi:excalibur calcium-binding domain-containing protein [Nocardioides panacisoli]|uniref:Fibronectin type-III domain-containing protein n=1 Tax=Nocardioides panacisoli TaxID=627624 RepID=A0ABP7HV09_9ACTN